MNTALFLRKAKEMLKRNWLEAALGSFVYLLICGAIPSIGLGAKSLIGLTYVLTMLVGGALYLGYILFISCLVDTRKFNLELLFAGFRRFVPTLAAYVLVEVVIWIGCCLLIVPGIIAACGLSMTFFIMADNPDISGTDAFKESWNLMKGHKMEYFIMILRFIGWALLCLLTFGIGFFWLVPYVTTSQLNFYRQLRYGTY